ncbi:unnamed protein product [Aureobasidium pullulans]|nr:unnamed protein product [Aureobasidium pullulans]
MPLQLTGHGPPELGWLKDNLRNCPRTRERKMEIIRKAKEMRSSSAHARCSGADKASASKRAAVDAPTAPEAKRRKVEVVIASTLPAEGGAPVNLFTQGAIAGHAGPTQAGLAGAGPSLTLLQAQLMIAKALRVTVLLLPGTCRLAFGSGHKSFIEGLNAQMLNEELKQLHALLAGAVLQGHLAKTLRTSHTIISEFIDRHSHKRAQEDRIGINDEDPKNYPRWNGHMGALGVTKRIQQHKGKEYLMSASSVIKPLQKAKKDFYDLFPAPPTTLQFSS